MNGLSEIVLDHFDRPRHVGAFDNPSGKGWAGSEDGTRPFVHIQVMMADDDRIEEARFRTYGCVAAIAASSFICDKTQGLSVEQARKISPHQLIVDLGGLPKEKEFCAELAIEALRAALDDACAKSVAPLEPRPA